MGRICLSDGFASFAVPSVLYATMHFIAYLLFLSMMLMRKHLRRPCSMISLSGKLVLDHLKNGSRISNPHGYMSIEHRNDKANFIDDLNTIPTYNLNHPNGVRTNWLHHTFPNEIFNDANHVKKSIKASHRFESRAKLFNINETSHSPLWKFGLSKDNELKDTVPSKKTLVGGQKQQVIEFLSRKAIFPPGRLYYPLEAVEIFLLTSNRYSRLYDVYILKL